MLVHRMVVGCCRRVKIRGTVWNVQRDIKKMNVIEVSVGAGSTVGRSLFLRKKIGTRTFNFQLIFQTRFSRNVCL